MDESGPGPGAHRRPLIIERPDLQTHRQRLLFGSLTLAFWAFWAYLWIPLASLLAWWFGIDAFVREIGSFGGGAALLRLLRWYAIVVVGLSGILLSWAIFNWWKFYGVERRAPVLPVQVDVLAPLTDVGASTLESRWDSRVLVVLHTQGGRIIGLRERDPLAQPWRFELPDPVDAPDTAIPVD